MTIEQHEQKPPCPVSLDDPAAWEWLYEHEFARCVRLLRWRESRLDADTAQDLVQEAFIRLWQRRARFPVVSNLGALAQRFVEVQTGYLVLERAERAKAHPVCSLEGLHEEEMPLVMVRLAPEEVVSPEKQAMLDAIATLPEGQQDILRLVAQGYTARQAWQALRAQGQARLSCGSVLSLLNRVQRRLRGQLERWVCPGCQRAGRCPYAHEVCEACYKRQKARSQMRACTVCGKVCTCSYSGTRCSTCYHRALRRGERASVKPVFVCAQCGRQGNSHARGLCRACYERNRRQQHAA